MADKQFTGGSPSARDKLNRMAAKVEALWKIRGDGQFITGGMTDSGGKFSLNINNVAARIPKAPLGWGMQAGKITSAASGGGKYNGRTVTGLSTAVATGNLAMPEGMTVAGSDNLLLLDLTENGLSTHQVKVDGTVFVQYLPVGVTSGGLTIGVFQSGGWGSVFSVWLTQNGGINGDDGSTTTRAYPAWTYDVFADAARSIQIGTAVAVEWHRRVQIAMTAAAHGISRYDGSTLVLINCDEYEDQGGCP